MIHELIQKKSIQTLLVILVAGIWIYNSWKIFSMSSEREIVRQPEVINLGEGGDLSIPPVSHFEYLGDFRDPFVPVLEKISGVTMDVRDEPAEPELEIMPVMTLTGILENMAIIQDEHGEVYFAAPGDSIGETVLTSISSDFVSLYFREKTFSIHLH